MMGDQREMDVMSSLSHSLQRSWPSDKNMLQSAAKEALEGNKETQELKGLLRKASMLCKPGGGVDPGHKALMKDLIIRNDAAIVAALEGADVNGTESLNAYLQLLSLDKSEMTEEQQDKLRRERKDMVNRFQKNVKSLSRKMSSTSEEEKQRIKQLEFERQRIQRGLGEKRSRPGSMINFTSLPHNHRLKTVPESQDEDMSNGVSKGSSGLSSNVQSFLTSMPPPQTFPSANSTNASLNKPVSASGVDIQQLLGQYSLSQNKPPNQQQQQGAGTVSQLLQDFQKWQHQRQQPLPAVTSSQPQNEQMAQLVQVLSQNPAFLEQFAQFQKQQQQQQQLEGFMSMLRQASQQPSPLASPSSGLNNGGFGLGNADLTSLLNLSTAASTPNGGFGLGMGTASPTNSSSSNTSGNVFGTPSALGNGLFGASTLGGNSGNGSSSLFNNMGVFGAGGTSSLNSLGSINSAELSMQEKLVLQRLFQEQQEKQQLQQQAQQSTTPSVAALLEAREREREARKQQRLQVRREKKSSRERQRRFVLNTLYDELAVLLFTEAERETRDRASVLQSAIDFCRDNFGLKVPDHVPGEDEIDDDDDEDLIPNGPNLTQEEKKARRRWKKSRREKQRRHNVNILSERLGAMLGVPEIKDKGGVLNTAIEKIKEKKGL